MLPWILGSAAVALLLSKTSKASAVSASTLPPTAPGPSPSPSEPYDPKFDGSKVPGRQPAPPAGYVRAVKATPAMATFARQALGSIGAIGNVQYATLADGTALAAVTEWHFHPKGYVGGPNGWHKGISLFRKATP
jgi:hypothetical protein